LGSVELPTVGEFNVRNALGAIAMAFDEGVSFEAASDALRRFIPTKKRQELVGEVADIAVYDDFAHHPTAVQATLEALRGRYPNRRIWAIFEAKSNTSRRRVFQQQYPLAFAPADRVILSKPWRKDEDLSKDELLDIDELAADIAALGPHTELIPEVVEWNQGPLGECAGRPLLDTRTQLYIGDVAALVADSRDAFDAILLDVDNGPEGLTQEDNNWLYSVAGLQAMHRAMRPESTLAIWSAGPSPLFVIRLKKAGFHTAVHTVRARPGKGSRHTIFVARRGSAL
jgi:hypothetical protein